LRIGPRVGIVPDTLRGWIRQDQINAGERPGTTTAESARVRELERETRELKMENEFLKKAAAYFARDHR
jgi:transposase-like protein